MKIKIQSISVEIIKHALCRTKLGIAGYIEAIVPNNRHVVIVGRWDDPYQTTDPNEQSHFAEHVWINGTYVHADFANENFSAEDSINLSLTDDFFTAEDIALAVMKHLES